MAAMVCHPDTEGRPMRTRAWIVLGTALLATSVGRSQDGMGWGAPPANCIPGCDGGGSAKCSTGCAPKCATGCNQGCGEECHAFRRLAAWAFYRPLCKQSSCCHYYCCHPPVYALFPCPPHVTCPCPTGCGRPVAATGPAPIPAAPVAPAPKPADPEKDKNKDIVAAGPLVKIPTFKCAANVVAPPSNGPAVTPPKLIASNPMTAAQPAALPVQTVSFNKPSGETAVRPVPPGPKLSTYDPKKIAAEMPVLNPAQFRKQVPAESCGK